MMQEQSNCHHLKEKYRANLLSLCGSRKYPYPHHGGNWKFQRGGGVNGPGNSRGEEG